jgi:type VI secretion system ImpM family protein
MSAPVCGYYGKLPVSREFLRLHAAGPELRELDEWFERGVQYAKAQAGSEWPALVAEADIWNFLYVPEGNGRAVCGAVFASLDQAGRSFPFLTFLLLERHALLPVPWLIPLACQKFLGKTGQLLRQLREDLDWNAFRTSVESLPAEVDTDASIEAGFEDYLSHTTIGEFWNRVCATADHPQNSGFVHERAIRLHPVGERSGAGAAWGLKLPLAKGSSTETYDVPFWLEFHARSHDAKKGAFPALFAFWNRAPSKVEPCLLLSFGHPSPNLTRFIVSPDVRDDAWYEWLPLQVNPQQTSSGGALHSSSQVVDNADVSLRSYLDLIG